MKRSKMTYLLCLMIVAVGFCGYSVLELCYENLQQSKAVFFRQAEFCDGFVECTGGTVGHQKTLERIDGILQAQARLVKDVGADEIRRTDGRPETVREEDVKLHLVSWEEGQMNRPVLSRGSYPEKGKRQMVIGEGIAAARSLKPGDQMILLIGGNRISMEITGVGMTPENIYMIRDMSEMLPNTACYDAAFASFETMEALFRMEGQANSFLLRLERETTWEKTQRQDLMVQFAVPVPKQDAMEAVRSEDVELAEGILGFPAVLSNSESSRAYYKSQIESCERQIKVLNESLGPRGIYMPYDGVIWEIYAEPGAYVSENQAAVKVYRPDSMKLRASVLSEDAVYLVRGDRAELTAVETGKREGGRVEIHSGVLEGDIVVADPYGYEIKDKSRVKAAAAR